MRTYLIATCLMVCVASTLSSGVAHGQASFFDWQIVVNNGFDVPGDTLSRKFNSYSQPSTNVGGLVTFRGRSQGGMGGQPAHGVYVRNMAAGSPIQKFFDRNTLVPGPRNLPTTFIEPPSFPRIDMSSNTIASRGNHPPVWRFFLPDGSESRAGTTGIYTNPFGGLMTGASNLGAVPYFKYFLVPGTTSKFDVFPGAPAVTDTRTIVFKGNYTDGAGVGRTGVYYLDMRKLANTLLGMPTAIVPIADNSSSLIPGTDTLFGSTAPPSAAGRLAVFAGFDNEDDPTLGGIYLAPLTTPYPPLTPLVSIGGQVPGEAEGTVFNKMGEGLSFDGRFVAFWGAWGTETKTLVLQCPTDGNPELIAYCMELYPNGYETTVPVNQGIFVHDIQTNQTHVVAKTPDNYSDFVYWNFSGRVPGTGEGDDEGELARWRSASFVSVSQKTTGNTTAAVAAFKARTGEVVEGAYVNPIDGIYLSGEAGVPAFTTVAETGMLGTTFDPDAVYDDDENPMTPPVPLPVVTMGIEREGLRGNLLSITLGMGTEEAGWAGIYISVLPTP